jgi:hypothetical protein
MNCAAIAGTASAASIYQSVRWQKAVFKPQYAQRQSGGGSVAPPPPAHPMLDVGWAKGPGDLADPTHFWPKRSVNALTAKLISEQTIWYPIRIFGVDQYRAICRAYTQGVLVPCESGNCSFKSRYWRPYKRADSGSADAVIFNSLILDLPQGYPSGTVVNDDVTFDNASLALLGITTEPIKVASRLRRTPLLAALPLLTIGLGGLGLLGWRRKRKAQVVA